jgi:hypothetical protein
MKFKAIPLQVDRPLRDSEGWGSGRWRGTGRPYRQEMLKVVISIRETAGQCSRKIWVNEKITPSGIESPTFRLVTQCLNQPRHRVPQVKFTYRAVLRLGYTAIERCVFTVQSPIGGGEWWTARADCFIRRKMTSVCTEQEGCVSPQKQSRRFGENKTKSLAPDWNLCMFPRSPSLYPGHYTGYSVLTSYRQNKLLLFLLLLLLSPPSCLRVSWDHLPRHRHSGDVHKDEALRATTRGIHYYCTYWNCQ